MHLLVLSAFRQDIETYTFISSESQCTFWCSVLSDSTVKTSTETKSNSLNAPFGAQCFPTRMQDTARRATSPVSMHLLVLSAFRPRVGGVTYRPGLVSMHLLVLSAFRRNRPPTRRTARSSVSMHLLVLSAFRHGPEKAHRRRACGSQCTFWCSVLSDSASRKPRRNAVSRDENAADLESTKSNRLAPLQLNHTTAENRHKSTQRRQHPLPIGTPPAFNEPTPKDRSLATPPR